MGPTSPQALSLTAPLAENENLPTILVIDDNEAVLSSFYELLSIDHDFKVILARTSEEALKAVETIPGPVIIILDQWLKDNAGNDVLGTNLLPELCKRSRMSPLTIMCSTDDSVSMELAAIRAGAQWSLSKADAGDLLIPRIWLAIHTFEKLMQGSYDQLTQALSRRGMYDIMIRELSRITRTPNSTPGSMACVMFDIDGLKSVNDDFGHSRGDELIRGASDSILQHIRRHTDIFCRFGGDEFVLFLSGIQEEKNVQDLINKICATFVTNMDKICATFATNNVGVSVGFCTLSFKDVRSKLSPTPHNTGVCVQLINNLIESADAKMYVQKNIRKGAL